MSVFEDSFVILGDDASESVPVSGSFDTTTDNSLSGYDCSVQVDDSIDDVVAVPSSDYGGYSNDGPVLPPPSEIDSDEGTALIERRRQNAIHLEEEEKEKEKREANQYFHKKRELVIDLVSDLQEEILVRLPLKSILRFKTVSKQWRSILESRSFTERRRIIMKKKLQFLAAADRGYPTVSQCAGDEEEVEMFYLDCESATRPSLACDGLVCIPVPGWISVLNPSTREFLTFASGPDPPTTKVYEDIMDRRFETFPGYWSMGFGRDIIIGNYKVVRMFFEPNYYGEILDINNGEWRKLTSPPPFYVEERLKSACVNGSIYWLQINILNKTQKILALDLYTEEFRCVQTPPSFCMSGQIANLEDCLVIVTLSYRPSKFNVWRMDAQEETWSITYSFTSTFFCHWSEWCMPLAISKQGNLFFYDQRKRLHKYYPETGLVQGITSSICVIAPFVENFLPLQRSEIKTNTFGFGFQKLKESQISKCSRQFDFSRIKLSISNFLQNQVSMSMSDILLTTTFVTLVIFLNK